MKYTIDKQEKYSLLRLHEDKLDSSVAPGLKSELITLHAEGVRNIVLDMSDVKYTDSSGLSALLVGNRIVQEDGGIFSLTRFRAYTKIDKNIQWIVSEHRSKVEEAMMPVFMHEIEKI